jgi:hypothetical protein
VAALPGPWTALIPGHDLRKWCGDDRSVALTPLAAITAKRARRAGSFPHPDAVSIERTVQRQAGVIALSQAVRLGLSARTVQRRVCSGAWRELYPLVYLVSGHRGTDEVWVRAAWLWAGGEPAAVTGPAAAYWHGMLDRAPAVVEITVPRATHRRSPFGIVVRRRDLKRADLVRHRDVWVAGRAFAALETAMALPDGSAFWTGRCRSTSRSPSCTAATAETWAGEGGPRRAG